MPSCSMSLGLPCVLFCIHPMRGETGFLSSRVKMALCWESNTFMLPGHVTRSGAFTWIPTFIPPKNCRRPDDQLIHNHGL